MKCYPKDTLDRFQFNEVLLCLETYCRTQTGKALALRLRPSDEQHRVELWLDQTHEYLRVLNEGMSFPPFQFPHIGKEMDMLAIQGAVLEAPQFMSLRETVETANGVIRFLRQKREMLPAMAKISAHLAECKEIVPLIDHVLEAPGVVKSSASKELATIRRDLQSKRQQANRVFMSELRKCQKAGWLRDFNESSYNSRRVLAVLAEYKRQVKGIIHGSSDTGRTTFIEPMETVEINNEIFGLEQEERREIHRILKELSNQVKVYLPELKGFVKMLTILDLTQAKSNFAIRLEASRPSISNEKVVELREARHPLLLLQNETEGKVTVPLNLELNQQQRIVVISGPNAGGKSIALKTMGLLQVMLQSGLLIPADENSIMTIFKQLYVDIGDDQSIEMELSTYSSRLVKMKYFLEFSGKDTLMFIDEFGTGSDPELGGAIAEVILERIAELRVMGIVTTHYSNIKILGDHLEGLRNACMLFNEKTLEPLYELSIGQPGSSYTFEVAKKIGLPKKVLGDARAKLDKKKVKLDQLLVKLQKEQNELNRQQSELQRELDVTEEKAEMYEALHQQLQSREAQEKANREVTNKLTDAGRKYLSLVELFDQKGDKKAVVKKLMIHLNNEKARKDAERKKRREEKLRAESDKKAREKARKKAAAAKKRAEQQRMKVEVGCTVKLKGGKQKGEVEAISGNKVTVVFGMMKTIAPINNLVVIQPPKKR